MGLLVVDLKEPKSAPKAGRIMIIGLTFIYVMSLALALSLVSWHEINPDESPFITALSTFHVPYVTDILNGILIIAGFSTMVAALYAVVTILTSLAEDHDAPARIAKKGKWKIPIPAFLFTAAGLFISTIIAILLPEKIFEYVTTAAGLMLIYNWVFILATYTKLMQPSVMDWIKTTIGMLLITVTVLGTVMEKASRVGFIVSLIFLLLIAIAASIIHKRRQY
ncbi:hypothetical protein GCM10008934_15400 [Virgibacillus salarius]